MLQDTTRFLSYLCPHCRQTVIVQRELFSLAAAPTSLPCPCGKSALGVEFLPDRVKLTAPCLFCGLEHAVTCSSRAFVGERALAFSCAASGLDCCYVGEREAVYAAAARLEQTAHRLEAAAEEQGAFLDELVMHEVLSEVREIAARDGISCTCGSRKWNLSVKFSRIDLVCAQCGGKSRIPAATAEDIESICCHYTIEIQGKGER